MKSISYKTNISVNDINMLYNNTINNEELLVEFCLCSRKRPNMLYKMFETTFETSDNPNDIAISVYFNEDDEVSLSQIDRYKNFPNTKLYVGPKQDYTECEYIAGCLFETSKAKWLCGSQDDTYIGSYGWDTQLKNIDINNNQIILPSKYQLGSNPANIYTNIEYLPQFFIPNQCWKKYSDWEYIPHPYDASIFQLLLDNNWTLKHIDMFWIHDRRGVGWNEIDNNF